MRAFVPRPLPPARPVLAPESYEAGTRGAELAVARLSGVSGLVRENLHDRRGLPLSVRLLCDAHRLLLAGARGANKQPGELRRSQRESWVALFLEAVQAAATEAERAIVAIASLVSADRRRLLAAPRVGAVALRLFELLPVMPRFTIEQVRQKLETTFPTAAAAVKLLEHLGLVSELTGQKKNRSFSYRVYVELLAR